MGTLQSGVRGQLQSAALASGLHQLIEGGGRSGGQAHEGDGRVETTTLCCIGST